MSVPPGRVTESIPGSGGGVETMSFKDGLRLGHLGQTGTREDQVVVVTDVHFWIPTLVSVHRRGEPRSQIGGYCVLLTWERRGSLKVTKVGKRAGYQRYLCRVPLSRGASVPPWEVGH